ncbi:MAG TPA: hypothetical protein VFE55_15165 [Acidimicrobiia bacterium]|nr:hypothetical protein [Acidimicrobiia bacterium]
MDLEALALLIDERVRVPAADRTDGRLFAVRHDRIPAVGVLPGSPGADVPALPDNCLAVYGRGDDDDDPDGGGACGAVVLHLLAEGDTRTLPQKVTPPAGLAAIALASGVWAAPLDDSGPTPSRHPQRRRAHLTVIVGAEAGRDAVDVSVLRYGDARPTVLRGGVGVVHQRLLRCWARRPDAPGTAQANHRAA